MTEQMDLKTFIFLYIALFINIGFYFNDHLIKIFLALTIITSTAELCMVHTLQIIKMIHLLFTRNVSGVKNDDANKPEEISKTDGEIDE